MARALASFAAGALLLASGSARPVPVRASAVPTTCTGFSVVGDDAVTCAATLTEGYTYQLYTSCETTKGLPILRLLDLDGTEVAYNDGFPFCGGNISAALIEFFIPCFEYPLPVNEFALSAECYLDSACSASLVIEESTKIPPEKCGRLPPPPPAAPAPPKAPFACLKQDATCAALGDLYFATGGAQWLQSDGWSAAAAGVPTDYCQFWSHASSCNAAGVFDNLHLEKNELVGTLPESIGQLTTLTWLELDTNELEGTLPASMGSLTLVEYLRMSGNGLSGTIPASLGSLSRATFFRLGSNQLEGTLPASFGSLSAVQILQLNDLQLSGPVPASLVSLSNLQTLKLADSGLCGPVPSHPPDDGELPACK